MISFRRNRMFYVLWLELWDSFFLHFSTSSLCFFVRLDEMQSASEKVILIEWVTRKVTGKKFSLRLAKLNRKKLSLSDLGTFSAEDLSQWRRRADPCREKPSLKHRDCLLSKKFRWEICHSWMHFSCFERSECSLDQLCCWLKTDLCYVN